MNIERKKKGQLDPKGLEKVKKLFFQLRRQNNLLFPTQPAAE